MTNLDWFIALWMGKKHSVNRDVILTALIRQKQFVNLDLEGL